MTTVKMLLRVLVDHRAGWGLSRSLQLLHPPGEHLTGEQQPSGHPQRRPIGIATVLIYRTRYLLAAYPNVRDKPLQGAAEATRGPSRRANQDRPSSFLF